MTWYPIEEEVDEHGKRFLSLDGIEIISKTGVQTVDKRKIFAISDEEVEQYSSLGVSEGQTFGHCIYLGWRFTEDFFGRVWGYRIVIPEHEGVGVALNFYEKKPN